MTTTFIDETTGKEVVVSASRPLPVTGGGGESVAAAHP
jgi:hypothetical protein